MSEHTLVVEATGDGLLYVEIPTGMGAVTPLQLMQLAYESYKMIFGYEPAGVHCREDFYDDLAAECKERHFSMDRATKDHRVPVGQIIMIPMDTFVQSIKRNLS